MDYTKCNLTKRSDLLPALSSIAAAIYTLHLSPYVVGLWKDRFIEDLCWRPAAFGDDIPPISNEDVDLPTWSWISIRHPVDFAVVDEPGTFIAHCTLLLCPCSQPTTQTLFGEFTNGS